MFIIKLITNILNINFFLVSRVYMGMGAFTIYAAVKLAPLLLLWEILSQFPY